MVAVSSLRPKATEGYFPAELYLNEKRLFKKILCIKSLRVTIEMKATE